MSATDTSPNNSNRWFTALLFLLCGATGAFVGAAGKDGWEVLKEYFKSPTRIETKSPTPQEAAQHRTPEPEIKKQDRLAVRSDPEWDVVNVYDVYDIFELRDIYRTPSGRTITKSKGLTAIKRTEVSIRDDGGVVSRDARPSSPASSSDPVRPRL
jgi:hypothetical protein